MSPGMSDDRSALIALLPHRAPFLFIDEVDACEPAVSVRARYRVTGAEPFLSGHFPGNPIFPGVLQLEALAQAGAIAVRPGEILDLAVDIERLSGRGGWGRGVATVDGAECCRARLLFALA